MRATESLKWARSPQNADSSQEGSRFRTEWFSFRLSEPPALYQGCQRSSSRQASNISGLLAVPEDQGWPDYSWESGAKHWKEAVLGSSLPRVQPITERNCGGRRGIPTWWASRGCPAECVWASHFPLSCYPHATYNLFCIAPSVLVLSSHNTLHSVPAGPDSIHLYGAVRVATGYYTLPLTPDASLGWGLHLDHLWPLSQACIGSTCESRNRS